VAWSAFDVPRLWDMVEPEGKWPAWDQITGFSRLADLLTEQYRLWRGRRDHIASAWQSPAAEKLLKRLDTYANDLLMDADCARQTAYALDRTVHVLTEARQKIAPLVSQWNNVTNDWIPEWWDNAASELNDQARRVMIETDKAVAAARLYIAAPQAIESRRRPPPPPEGQQPGPTASGAPLASPATSAAVRSPIPPMPGHDPLLEISGSPELASLPQFIPAVPGQPVSMLPISPGSPYAPFGGAYILPGPGVGQGGYVVPMPRNPAMGSGTLMPPAPGSGGGAVGGMVPMPMPGAPGGTSGHGAIYRRANVLWQAGKGVPPVIRLEEDEFVPDRPSPKQEEEFRDWFTELAYPWRAEFKSSEGAQVTIRTVDK
jgi:hypothetical protein